MKKELRNCPFCGKQDAKIFQEDECFYVQCNCGICTVICETEEGAKSVWNTRAE